MILIETVSFFDLQLQMYYDPHESMSTTNAAALAEQITAILAEEPVIILFIFGRFTQTNENVVFGYHLPWYDSPDEGWNHSLLIQLSPVLDFFQGYNTERSGFKPDENETLIFGGKGTSLNCLFWE
ncbi:uncharacterized protein EURHEDRAFT_408421 [Aspergillus ruber CBS 135680]|uniref:Uncharacterized protein n=1 Tax=Aspergillus ruber (strain CBS 135680) TaxID=1388766 RepID=A0A017SRF7_ASPRC|nr:uncharacterized protein EURHEDRAFT_408421 [Aspergillus ruber CBS 135680]EYE99164.1 hypothetical protein EURHEDRAFT_408421 [Aspergillus ruber CBS 135680]